MTLTFDPYVPMTNAYLSFCPNGLRFMRHDLERQILLHKCNISLEKGATQILTSYSYMNVPFVTNLPSRHVCSCPIISLN